eukprot:767503-Hanusia_phi.AAC.2
MRSSGSYRTVEGGWRNWGDRTREEEGGRALATCQRRALGATDTSRGHGRQARDIAVQVQQQEVTPSCPTSSATHAEDLAGKIPISRAICDSFRPEAQVLQAWPRIDVEAADVDFSQTGKENLRGGHEVDLVRSQGRGFESSRSLHAPIARVVAHMQQNTAPRTRTSASPSSTTTGPEDTSSEITSLDGKESVMSEFDRERVFEHRKDPSVPWRDATRLQAMIRGYLSRRPAHVSHVRSFLHHQKQNMGAGEGSESLQTDMQRTASNQSQFSLSSALEYFQEDSSPPDILVGNSEYAELSQGLLFVIVISLVRFPESFEVSSKERIDLSKVQGNACTDTLVVIISDENFGVSFKNSKISITSAKSCLRNVFSHQHLYTRQRFQGLNAAKFAINQSEKCWA